MTTEVKKTEENPKELKKLIDAQMAVLHHKLGRAPTLEELMSELQEDAPGTRQESQEPVPEENSPKILSYKIYYGLKDGKDPEGQPIKVPCPEKPLFYQSPDGRCYDTVAGQWYDQSPDVLQHLQSRPLMFDEEGHDIMSAMLHGVLEDDDFDMLDKAEMLNDYHKQVYSLKKQIYQNMAELEKSDEPDPEGMVEDTEQMENTEVVEDFQDVESDDMPGDDVISEIVRLAMEEIDSDLERKVRMILEKILSEE